MLPCQKFETGWRSFNINVLMRHAMTPAETNVLLELEKILQTCNQMFDLSKWARRWFRNKLLVKTIELAKGSHLTAQKKALEAMDVWKRLNDEKVEISDEEMDVDEWQVSQWIITSRLWIMDDWHECDSSIEPYKFSSPDIFSREDPLNFFVFFASPGKMQLSIQISPRTLHFSFCPHCFHTGLIVQRETQPQQIVQAWNSWDEPCSCKSFRPKFCCAPKTDGYRSYRQ